MRMFKTILFASMFIAGAAQAAPVKTVLAAGCFWSMQKNMDHAPGVSHVTVGYAGGSTANPTYEDYHDGDAPHVEAVEVTYDDAQTSYAQILNYYFHHIDPTDARGQFCDFGPGYKPVIFVNGDAERKIAEEAKAQTAKELGRDVAVDIRDASAFWPAEEYHQDFYKKNPDHYNRYALGCGRAEKLAKIWGTQ